MKFIVLNRNEKRIRNIETFNTIRKVKVSALDTIEFDTYADFLEKYYRILYKDSLGLWHEYLVLSIERIHDENGIYYHVYLENSLTELRGDFIEDLRASNSSAQNALDKLLSVTRWKGEVSGINPSTTNFYRISAFEGLSKLLTDFGGEITTKIEVSGSRVINRVVVYKNFIGKDLGKRFSFSKDIKSVTKTIEEDDVITALYGYGKSEELENENGESSYTRKISFSELNDGKGYVENTDAKLAYGIAGRHRFGSIFFDDIDNKSLLLSKTKEALEALSKPKVVYEVDVIDLKSYGFDFEGVSCGDFVVIRDGELKESLNARVLELEENLDKEGTTKLVLGSIRLGIADYTKSIKNEVSNLKSKEALYDKAYLSLSKLDNVTYIDEVVKALNDQFKSGTSNAFFDVNRGIVITDKKTEKDSTWIMELSSLGFRIANSKNSNGQWNFSTFGTGDGFTANLIRAGILEGGKVKFDLENGTFNIGDALIWDGENLTLSAKSIKTVVESEVTSKLNDPAIREAFKGDKGDRGLQGIQGIQGLEGPKGDQGIQGPVGKTGATGATGAKGVDGKSSYTHIAYATNQTGITGFSVSDSLNKTYIGIYVDNIATDSSDPSKYKWTLIKGADGKNGIAGAKGADGKTPYFHIAYATNQTGTTGFSVTDSVGKTYIGQYTDYTQADSLDPSKYKWTLIKGDKGATGATGVGLKTVENQYALSTSKDVAPTSGWSGTAIYEENKYLWRRLKITYTNGNIVYVGEEYVVDPNTLEDDIFEITTKLKIYTDKTDEHITSIAEMEKTITNLDGEIETVSKTSTAAKQTADSFTQEFTRLENALSDNEKDTKEIKALIKSGMDDSGNTYTEWGSSSNSTVRVGAGGIEMISNKVSTMVLKDGVVEAKALNVSERIGFGNHTAQKYKDEFTIFSWTGGK